MRKETIQTIEDVIYMNYVNVINDLHDEDLLKEWKEKGIDTDNIYKTMLVYSEENSGTSRAIRFDGKDNIVKEIEKLGKEILVREF